MYEKLSEFQRSRLESGLKRQLRRRYLLTADKDDREAIRNVLNDDFLVSLVVMESAAVFAASDDNNTSAFMDVVLKMLIFFIDNWEIILEIIKAISGSHL